jgi:hypothetical protein
MEQIMASEPKITPLYELPNPGSISDAQYLRYLIRYEFFRDGEWYRSGLRFNGVAATRTRVERCSTEWHLDAYDTLVEVEDSDWVKEIRADTTPRYRDRWQMHHYMIYMDGDGAFEFIADGWEVLPEEKGKWPEIPTA